MREATEKQVNGTEAHICFLSDRLGNLLLGVFLRDIQNHIITQISSLTHDLGLFKYMNCIIITLYVDDIIE